MKTGDALGRPVLEVAEVRPAPCAGALAGGSIDAPRAEATLRSRLFELSGWVVPADQPAVLVEIVVDGVVVRRAPVEGRRADLAAAFPDVAWAGRAGFSVPLALLARPQGSEVEVRCVLPDQQRVPVGTIALWPAAPCGELGPSTPLVSVIIPCHRQAHFLGEAVESVLQQGHPCIEIVVVDDGSPDNTAAVVGRYPGVRRIEQVNRGVAAARNTGLRHARGELVVFLDADDRLAPGALAAGVRALGARPEAVLAVGGTLMFSDTSAQPTEVVAHDLDGAPYATLLAGSPILAPASVMYRAHLFREVRGFDERLDPAADYELYYRLARTRHLAPHGEVAAHYRRHGTNMTRDPGRMLRANLTALRRQRGGLWRHPRYWTSYRQGVRYWRETYGPDLTIEIACRAHAGDLVQACRGLVTLVRYWPQGLSRVGALLRSTLSARARRRRSVSAV